ncbi:VOC family protein [Sphingosinicella sp. BN140058]|uniref:VOC family protein n=1 Tax=Sphingosinicella sp. BN140058 TaxID=1892855 RepID=UPI0010118226|nr:VOC family protein [Sphingosinicella sp. BN140058]QAY75192.1 VOC family protein [Sphingosinicella sp. BN140058]
MTQATPFLMFQGGTAEAALSFYAETVPDSRIESIERFGADGPGPEGTILRAVAVIAGQRVMAHDSFITHGFDFTPSWSIFLDCRDRAEFDRLFDLLSSGGAVLMPADDYGWSARFAWVSDRFGISWQLNLERGHG